MKKRNRKIRSAMAAALAVSMVAAPCSSALAASTSDEITQREIDNAALAREAAGQGMVLLENENHTLPLKTKKLALFGSGAVRTIKAIPGKLSLICRIHSSVTSAVELDAAIRYNFPAS